MVYMGKKYRDVLTGFEGVCTGETVYITGCHRILLQPQSDDPNKVIESMWLDSVSCEMVDENPLSLPTRIVESLRSLLPGPAPKLALGPGREAPKQ